MSVLKDYEREVLYTLASDVLSPRQLSAVADEGELVGYDYTGRGYFLTVRHESLPRERIVCNSPMLSGSAGGVNCGFVIFIEDGELTIECHPWDEDVPEDFRDREVRVTAARVEEADG
ncbi:MAG TPA: hypothetical protein VGP08_09345 [Pyrinomonadaceae bacterium]|jgi:hypothetical protein|nr:hypothetical protein [Pyrinomonadaceae bacterium]